MASGEPGEQKAWDILAGLDSDGVSRRASVSVDPTCEAYRISSFGMDFTVSPRERTISSSAPGSALVLKGLGHFFRLSLLWYLVSAKDIPPSGRLVRLESVRGGDIFSKGSHVLPLDRLAARYGRDRQAFLARGAELAGVPEGLADTALRIAPLPRIPVVLTLWLEDEEFPARADLLFDSTCELQLPTDILWSVAMTSVLVMA